MGFSHNISAIFLLQTGALHSKSIQTFNFVELALILKIYNEEE